MYRSLTLALAAALMSPLTQAMAEVHLDAKCEVESAYDLTVEPTRLVFTQAGRGEVAFAQGRVYLDGNALTLSPADSNRVAEFERSVRALIPDVKHIAVDAIEIAFTALNRVIDTFATANNRAALTAELGTMRSEIAAAVDQAQSTTALDDKAFQDKIEAFVSRMAPMVAGELASQAVTAALSGDDAAVKAIEAKADRLEKEIEASVEAPAKSLEARVNALCPRVEALDRIDDALELRLPDGKALDLIEVDNKA